LKTAIAAVRSWQFDVAWIEHLSPQHRPGDSPGGWKGLLDV
jgi:hypothetical protein